MAKVAQSPLRIWRGRCLLRVSHNEIRRGYLFARHEDTSVIRWPARNQLSRQSSARQTVAFKRAESSRGDRSSLNDETTSNEEMEIFEQAITN